MVYLLSGLLQVVCGALMVGQPMLGLHFMTILLAIFFLASGVGEVMHAVVLRPSPGWVWVLCSGLVSLVLSVFIWTSWPLSGDWAIGVLVGIRLFTFGVALAVVGIAARTMIHEEQATL